MNVSHNLGAIAGHADTDPFMQGPEPGQDQLVGQHLQQERQQVQCRADVGIVGHHVACGGVHLRQGLKELREPRQLDVNVYSVR